MPVKYKKEMDREPRTYLSKIEPHSLTIRCNSCKRRTPHKITVKTMNGTRHLIATCHNSFPSKYGGVHYCSGFFIMKEVSPREFSVPERWALLKFIERW